MTDGNVTTPRDPAPRRYVTAWRAMLGTALVIAAVAVSLDLANRFVWPTAATVPARLLAAAAMALTGSVLLWSLLERRGREVPRRRTPLLLFAIGNGVLYGFQALFYVAVAAVPGAFPAWVEAAPLAVGGLLMAVGLVWLCWPPGLSRRDLWGVGRDSLMGWGGLITIWVTLAVRAQDNPQGLLIERFDPYVQMLGFATLVLVAALSRRSGALPAAQLLFLQGGVLIYLLSDIVGHVVPELDRSSAVTYSILGYVTSSFLILAFAVRPALETDSPRMTQVRDTWSYLIPYLPMPVAVAALIVSRAVYGPLPTPVLSIGLCFLLVAATVMAIDRIVLSRDRQGLSHQRVAANLSDSSWLATLIGDTTDLVSVVDRDGRIRFQTPSLQPMLGFVPGAFTGRPFTALVRGREEVSEWLLRAAHDDNDRGPYDVDLINADGGVVATQMWVAPLRTEGVDGFVLTSRDATDLRRSAVTSARRDAITGLGDRGWFLERLRRELPAAPPGHLALMLFDVRGFRDLNDSRGHDVGDSVLRLIGQTLERLPAEVRAVARTGADEFGLLVVADPVDFAVGETHRAVTEGLERTLLPDGSLMAVGIDLGYAVADSRQASASGLVEQADLALAEARSVAGARVVRFEPAMRRALVARLRAEADLREALDSDRLVAHYQPIVDLETGRIVGAEALARLQGPDGEFISPAEFVVAAETLGLIDRLGERILQQSLRDLPAIVSVLERPVSMSVNVSAEQLTDGFIPMVQTALAAGDVTPRDLVLELTETAYAADPDRAAGHLRQVRALGCRVALDDFGTGYSSMTYLADLPADFLKVDRSFVVAMGSSRRTQVLVRTMLQMAQSLGLTAIAEGVETLEQADLLRGMGCPRAQGYLFGRPMALPDLLLTLDVAGGVLPFHPGIE